MGKAAKVWTGTAWVDLVGLGMNAYAPINFGHPGVLTVSSTSLPYMFAFNATIIGVSASCNTAPTGAAILIDVNKNGTTIFTTQSNRPTIAIGAYKTTGIEVVNMDVTTFNVGDILSVHVDQVGSTIAGADLSVSIRYEAV